MRNTTTGSRRSRSRTKVGLALSVATLAGAVAIASADGPAAGDGWEAVAVLRDTNDRQVGKVRFEGDRNGTEVKVDVHGIGDPGTGEGRDSYHGFHLHAGDGTGVCDPETAGAFMNVGGHWNPQGVDHGSHAGDLPSIQVLSDGTGSARSVTGRFQADEIGGLAVILHAGPDNFANIPTRYATSVVAAGPDGDTKKTGDAGKRIACGIIELD